MAALLQTGASEEQPAPILWNSDRMLLLGQVNAHVGFVLDFAVTFGASGRDAVNRDLHLFS
jgi:hypothetical protein